MAEFGDSSFNLAPFNRPQVQKENAPFFPDLQLPEVERYPLRVYDSTFTLIGEIDDYVSLEWIRRWRTPGEFTLKVTRYDVTGADRDLSGNYWISIYRGGTTRIGRIENMEITCDQGTAGGAECWTIRGSDAKGIFKDRIAYVSVSAGTGYDTQTTQPAETAIRHYVDGNCISATDTSRNISALQLETDGARGGNISYSARLEYLHEVIENILLASPTQIGYDVLFDRATKKLSLHFIAGTDRSASVKFSTLFGNASNVIYTYDTASLRNVAYVGDAGEDASRNFSKVPSGTEATGLDRREIFVDGSDATTSTELTQKGTEALRDAAVDESLTFDIVADNSFAYMTRDASGNFDLGDIITAVYSGVATVAARIIEITEQYGDSAGTGVTLTLGTARPDMKAIVRLQERKYGKRRRV